MVDVMSSKLLGTGTLDFIIRRWYRYLIVYRIAESTYAQMS